VTFRWVDMSPSGSPASHLLQHVESRRELNSNCIGALCIRNKSQCTLHICLSE